MPDEETNSLNTRIERLEREVLDLQRRIELLTGLEPEKIPRFAPNSPAPPRVEIPPKRAETPVAAAISPELLPMTTPIPAPAAPPPPSRTHEEWETLIGGKLLNRIGALALILGMGFFLKYAFDNQWISETVRVLIGGFIGTLLIAGAWRFHRRGLPIFAQGLLGAGISILYLSVYAAFNFYHLVTLPVAFVLMSMVTGAALVQALRCNSLAVTLLGWCGGFLTPFLLASGEPNEAGLFTYLILLDLGLLGVLFRRPRWALLEPLTLLATYLIYFLSYSSSFRQADPFLTLFFLAGFWGLFFALDLVLILRPAASLPELRRLIHALNAGLFSLGLYDLIAPNFPAWTGAAFLALGAVYFLSHLETRRRLDPGGTAPARQALAAAALLVFATSVQFSGRLLVAAWSLEAAALVWYGVYRGPAAVWKTGLALYGLAALRLCGDQLLSWTPSGGFFFWNERALTYGALAASLGAAIFPMRRISGETGDRIRDVLHYCWGAVLFALCSVETYVLLEGHFPLIILLSLALSWMLYALVMSGSGLKTRTAPVLFCGLIAAFLAFLVGITSGLTAFTPIQDFRLLLNARALILLALIGGGILLTFRIKDIRHLCPSLGDMIILLPLALVFLGFSLLTGETMDYFRKSLALLGSGPNADTAEMADRLRNLQQMSLSAVWMFYSIFLVAYGMWRRIPPLRIVAITLFGFTILKIFIYDLSFLVAVYRIVSFLGLGVVLLGVSYLYQRYKTAIFERPSPAETVSRNGDTMA